MGTMKFYNLKSHFTRVVTMFEFLPTFRFDSIFLVSFCTFMLKIFGFISKYLYRSKSSVVLSSGLAEKETLELHRRKDFGGNIADREDSVFLQSGWVANTSKYEFLSGKSVAGTLEEPKTAKFMVQEIFVESNENLVTSDKSVACEIYQDSLEQKLEKSSQKLDEESDSSSFGFDLLFNSCCSIDEKTDEENEKSLSVEGTDSVEDELLEDQDFSYEVELLPQSQESVAAGNGILISEKIDSFDKTLLEGNNSITFKSAFPEEADHQTKPESIKEDEYIELEPLSVNSTDMSAEIFCFGDDSKAEEVNEPESTNSEGQASFDGLQDKKDSWDSDSDSDDEDESDVLSEHQNSVRQMKMELKNCRIGSLPAISEECETPKMLEDLKPLKIDQKFEYKDIMEEIQKFYKIYAEKMRKLDVLNYQTLHSISFLQLKCSEAFTAGKKRSASSTFNLPKIWPCKVQRIYTDPMQKSIMDMHRDLELVYLGQLCLSWEILCWLSVKAQELMEYDSEGHHSYNRVAEEFQQFQVLLQRFLEDEPFQEPRILNYVKKRCMARRLLHVPTVKDDCLKDKKDRREETDIIISLNLLVEIIRESMVIFWEFLRSDKGSSNVVLKGIRGTKVDVDVDVDVQDTASSVALLNIISNLHKMDRRIREQMRSQNCIVKKLQKHRECNNETLKSKVELRLVSRVLSLSRVTEDQLVWCQKKLRNISFVGRRVHVEPSFLLFPC